MTISALSSGSISSSESISSISSSVALKSRCNSAAQNGSFFELNSLEHEEEPFELAFEEVFFRLRRNSNSKDFLAIYNANYFNN